MDTLARFMIFDSFWSIWFWAAHVVAWSLAAHFTMGVPYDMILEANREKGGDGPYAEATEAMILAQVFRFTSLFRRFGVVLTGVSAFLVSMLITLGTLGDSELALALATILGPLMLIYILTVRAAFRLEGEAPRGAELRRAIRRQRLWNQLVGSGAVAIAVALAVWDVIRDVVPFAA